LKERGAPSEQAILADAEEPYILYPAKRKIDRILLILLTVTVVFAVGAAWMLTLKDGRLIVAGFLLECLAALCCLTCLLLIYRLISRKPALVLTHLGLIDGSSALSGGVGPVWWDEVALSVFSRRQKHSCAPDIAIWRSHR
jgi:hypothetical protein